MRVWNLKTGEPVPFLEAEKHCRPLRSGLLTKALLEQQHSVLWWTANFNHQNKSYRKVAPNTCLAPDQSCPNLSMIYLRSLGYKRHIGPRRFFDHAFVAANFLKLASSQPAPDIIVSAYPTLDLTAAAVWFGKKHDIPTVVDVRDLWPDVIAERLPKWAKGAVSPYFRLAEYIFQNADSVTGISQGAIDWARVRFGARPGAVDRPFYHSKPDRKQNDRRQEASRYKLLRRGVDLALHKTRLVWVGNIVPETDAETLLEALYQLPKSVSDQLEVVICGEGSFVEKVKAAAADLPHLIYAGWVDAEELATLTEASHIGLLCYLDRFDFQRSLPNKVVDYCAASMRTLTNLSGEVPRLLKDSGSVISYATGDAKGLSRVLMDIAADPKRYRVKHAPARAVFEEHFNASKVLPAYVTFLEKLAQR